MKIATKLIIMKPFKLQRLHFRRNLSTYLFCFLFSLFLSCSPADNQDEDNGIGDQSQVLTTEVTADSLLDQVYMAKVEIPAGYSILSEATGDLDGDGIDEKAIVFNTEREAEMGTERELRIYVDQNGTWSLWHTSVGPILSSESGGLLGDPFESIEIVGGNLIISHYGGSSDRWSYLHEFQYGEQNWNLVAATLISYRSCEYSETYTYDLVKRTGFHSYQTEECNVNGETIRKEMDIEETLIISSKEKNPTMDHFQPGQTKAHVKGNQESYYY